MENALFIGHIDSKIQHGENMMNFGDFHGGIQTTLKVNEEIRGMEERDLSQDFRKELCVRHNRCAAIILRGTEVMSKGTSQPGVQSHEGRQPVKIVELVMIPDSKIYLEDIVGMDAIKQTLIKAVLLPNAIQDAIPSDNRWRGILLFGSSGTGKSKVIRALANSIKKTTDVRITFLNITLDKVNGSFHGHTEKNLLEIFRAVETGDPTILLFDEIDSLCSDREKEKTDPSEKKIVNHFLTLLDGIQGNVPVVLIGTTNKPQAIDPAFYRRFQKMLYVELPTTIEREKLLREFVGRIQKPELSVCIKFSDMARDCWRFSPADLGRMVTGALQDVRLDRMGKEVLQLMEKQRKVNFSTLVGQSDKFRILSNADLLQAKRKTRPTNKDADISKLDEFADKYCGRMSVLELTSDFDCCTLKKCVEDPHGEIVKGLVVLWNLCFD